MIGWRMEGQAWGQNCKLVMLKRVQWWGRRQTCYIRSTVPARVHAAPSKKYFGFAFLHQRRTLEIFIYTRVGSCVFYRILRIEKEG